RRVAGRGARRMFHYGAFRAAWRRRLDRAEAGNHRHREPGKSRRRLQHHQDPSRPGCARSRRRQSEVRRCGESRRNRLPRFQTFQSGNLRQRAPGVLSQRVYVFWSKKLLMTSVIPAPGEFLAGIALFLIVVWDAFEAIILPRRVTRKFRLTRLFFRSTWVVWKFVVNLVPTRKPREALLGFYGPLSLLPLVGVWAIGLVFGFGLMQYGTGSALIASGSPPGI